MSIHRSVLVLAALASLATAGTSASAWGHGRSGYFGGPRFAGVFDHVMMNPPYHDEARHDVSSNPQKRKANTEKATRATGVAISMSKPSWIIPRALNANAA